MITGFNTDNKEINILAPILSRLFIVLNKKMSFRENVWPFNLNLSSILFLTYIYKLFRYRILHFDIEMLCFRCASEEDKRLITQHKSYFQLIQILIWFISLTDYKEQSRVFPWTTEGMKEIAQIEVIMIWCGLPAYYCLC